MDSDCLFFNSPKTVGHGGGLATIFKICFKCKLLLVDNFLSFEVQLSKVDLPTSLLYVLVYKPPKFSKDFIQEFSDFLASLVDSFNLVQFISGPTNKKGHTLDLVFSFAFSVIKFEICDAAISDHCPVVFDFVLSCTKSIQIPSLTMLF